MERDSEFRRQWIEKSRKASRGMTNRHKFTKDEQSRGGRKSIGRDIYQYHKREKEILASLLTGNNRIFPNYIVDGFEFKDGVLNIIEIKINSGKLSEAQKEFERLIRRVKLIKFKVIHDKMVGWQS